MFGLNKNKVKNPRDNKETAFAWQQNKITPQADLDTLPPDLAPWKQNRIVVPGIAAQNPKLAPVAVTQETPVNNAPTVQPSPQNPVETVKPKSRIEQIKAEIEERKTRKFNDKWGILDTFKGGGIGFLKAFAQSNPNMPIGQRLLAALGGAGVGAVQGTFDPNTDEKWGNENHLNSLYGQYSQQAEMDETEAKQKKAENDAIKSQFETQGVFLSNQGKQLDNLRTLSKPFYDSIMADDIVTEEEAAQANAKYNLDLKPYDKRQFETQFVNGKPFTAPKLGVPVYARNPTLPDDSLKVPVESTIDDQKFTSTSPQAMTAKVGVLNANAQREQQAAQYRQTQDTQTQEREYRSEKEFEDDKRAWQTRVRSAKADSQKAKTRLESLEATRKTQADAGYDTTSLDTQIAAAKGDLAAAEVNMQEAAPKKIIRPKVVDPRTKKSGKNDNIGTTGSYQQALKKVRGY